MGDDLFQDLPAPSAINHRPDVKSLTPPVVDGFSLPPVPPRPALKSALKRAKPTPDETPKFEVAAPEKPEKQEKRLRFKTTTDASEEQVIGAMAKIATHMNNPTKFSKASKLAVQLIQAGSVKTTNSHHFFAILEAAMLSPTACNEASLRSDYHALFSAAQDASECLDKKQRNQLITWTLSSVVANDLFTDDSFVFSKALGKVREAISSLPVATTDEDTEEAAALNEAAVMGDTDGPSNKGSSAPSQPEGDEPDPFGLDALIPSTSNKDDKVKVKRNAVVGERKEEEETKRFLKSQREALISCLEIAAKRYKIPWCQTGIDILVKFAFDNISRFTSKQRDAIEKLWASIREQQVRRKQGKSVSGKLDVNGFEWLQQKYAGEKISIRHSVGGSGDRKCQQWLG